MRQDDAQSPKAIAMDIDNGTTMIRRGGPEVFRKVLVTGLGRGGTTALSSIFTELGYHRGNAPVEALGEDAEFQRLLVKPDPETLVRSLTEWGEAHEAVAWKDPKLFSGKGQDFIKLLPDDWLLAVIFRDPLATASRRVHSDGVELLPIVSHVVKYQLKLVNYLRSVNKSVVMVSYEKLMNHPGNTLDHLLKIVASPRGPVNTISLWNDVFARRKTYRALFELPASKEVTP